jgi:hypothetical protein
MQRDENSSDKCRMKPRTTREHSMLAALHNDFYEKHTFGGTGKESNVLGERDDCAAKAFCYDAECESLDDDDYELSDKEKDIWKHFKE